ncbi:MAG: dephospho-CoA kinase [Chloroflexi bacterium]|nr:dephospho-CoA kinase [Chloroflexota bacterium]
MITIAVTGGIGAGKSETVEILKRLGAKTVNADLLGHAAYASGTSGYHELVSAFGDEIVGEDGEINRKIVGEIVFRDEAKLKTLQSIVWHRIRATLKDELKRNRTDRTRATALEAAVLYEAGWQDLADCVWTVEATYHLRLARIVKKTGMSEGAARNRMDAQLAPEIRIEKADEVICNNGDLAALKQRVTDLWRATTEN